MLQEVQDESPLPPRALLALVALMHDSDSRVSRIAAFAAAELICHNMIDVLADSVLDRLLDMASHNDSNQVRKRAAFGLRKIAEEAEIDTETRRRIQEVLDSVASDISFSVRTAASG